MTNLYFKSLTPLSLHLISLFNKYDEGQISENYFATEIHNIFKKNRELIQDENGEYSDALKKRIGIKRMRILKSICSSIK